MNTTTLSPRARACRRLCEQIGPQAWHRFGEPDTVLLDGLRRDGDTRTRWFACLALLLWSNNPVVGPDGYPSTIERALGTVGGLDRHDRTILLDALRLLADVGGDDA